MQVLNVSPYDADTPPPNETQTQTKNRPRRAVCAAYQTGTDEVEVIYGGNHTRVGGEADHESGDSIATAASCTDDGGRRVAY